VNQSHLREATATLRVFYNSLEGLCKKAEEELKTFGENSEKEREKKKAEKKDVQAAEPPKPRLPPPLGKSGPGPVRTQRQPPNVSFTLGVDLNSYSTVETAALYHTLDSALIPNVSLWASSPTLEKQQVGGQLQAQRQGQGYQKVNRRLLHRNKHQIQSRKRQVSEFMLEAKELDLMQGVKPVNIHNLTSKTLTDIQQKCLSFGIHFLPRPNKDTIHLSAAMKSFCRSMRLMWIYKDKIQSLNKYHVKSDWNPTSFQSNPALEAELADLQKMLEAGPSSVVNQNWPKQLRESLKSIIDDPSLLLITADKNLGYCLVTVDWYRAACLAHLSHAKSYSIQNDNWLGNDNGHSTMINLYENLTELTNEYHDVLSSDELNFILEEKDWKLMQFYITAKVHKQPVKGRPIVPTMTWITHNLSVWLSDELNPLVKRIPTILKDTTHLLYKLNDPTLIQKCKDFKDKLWIISCDVEALYPSINIEAGVMQLKKLLEREGYQPARRREFLLKAARFVLDTMFIYFDKKIYQQIFGAAMGSSFVPPYANIFMHELEHATVERWYNSGHLLLYCRFIDDILGIIQGSEATAVQFIKDLNSMDPSISLTHYMSQKSIDFLDLTIFLNKNGILRTKAYQKALNPYTYLPWNSYHSIDMKKGFIKGEAIRYARLCSDISDFNHLLQLFTTRLSLRGYPQHFISKVLSTVFWVNRKQYLRPKIKNKLAIPLLFKIQNNPANDKAWMRKCLNEFTRKVRQLHHLPETMKRDIVICQMLPPKLHTQVLKARKAKGF
jgi:hypothetical protein